MKLYITLIGLVLATTAQAHAQESGSQESYNIGPNKIIRVDYTDSKYQPQPGKAKPLLVANTSECSTQRGYVKDNNTQLLSLGIGTADSNSIQCKGSIQAMETQRSAIQFEHQYQVDIFRNLMLGKQTVDLQILDHDCRPSKGGADVCRVQPLHNDFHSDGDLEDIRSNTYKPENIKISVKGSTNGYENLETYLNEQAGIALKDKLARSIAEFGRNTQEVAHEAKIEGATLMKYVPEYTPAQRQAIDQATVQVAGAK